MNATPLRIYCVALPGLEEALLAEAQEIGFSDAVIEPGGVAFTGGWPEVWRANLQLRCASRILARIGSFRAFHLAQLDKRARKFPWLDTLRPGLPVKVETACHRSKIYHAGAATQRIAGALEGAGIPVSAEEARLRLLARIDDNLVTLSVDTSGAGLHQRDHKAAPHKAPLRETMAAAFLRLCGFDGSEPVLDPMCGSGTIVIEAAEIAAGLAPGRSRQFAFEDLRNFDPSAWSELRAAQTGTSPTLQFHGYDRDDGAIRASEANAARAGVAEWTRFARQPVSDLAPPEGSGPGLVLVNPPYGARIGNRKLLFGLYGALGKRLLAPEFKGWRVGLVTSDGGLAKATGLPFLPKGPAVAHGGLKVSLYRTGPLS